HVPPLHGGLLSIERRAEGDQGLQQRRPGGLGGLTSRLRISYTEYPLPSIFADGSRIYTDPQPQINRRNGMLKKLSYTRLLWLALFLVLSVSAFAQDITVQATPLHRFRVSNATLGHYLTPDFN